MNHSSPITLKSVAAACGVSPSAVSRILQLDDERYNAETRQLVRETARRLNYQPNFLARAVRTGKTGVVGILILRRGRTEFARWPSEWLEAANWRLLDAGYQVLLTQITPEQIVRSEWPLMIAGGLAEGILAYGFVANLPYLELLRERMPALVSIEDQCQGTPAVIFDEYQAGAVVAEHFFRCGYRETAVINSTDDTVRHQLRIAGFIETLRRCWGDADLPVKIYRDDAWTPAAGIQTAQAILAEKPLPRAVFAINDYFGRHAMLEFRRAGLRVPADIAIAGVGGPADYIGLLPSGEELTSAMLDRGKIGQLGAEKLIAMLALEKFEPVTQVPVTLKLGDTTSLCN